MPKRHSLVGTGREAMGEPAGAQSEAPARSPAPPKSTRKKPHRALPKERHEAAREALPAAEASTAMTQLRAAAPERDRVAPPSPVSAYEVMMGFASAALRQNMETGARLARCKSPLEVLAAQTAHIMALTQSFFAISIRLMSTASRSRGE